tara:strand:- start:642 stop:2360 length:1719 start_codon:yes stop_codon:yes gene_type:complete
MGLTKATEKSISDNLQISGIATATNFKTGSTNVHSVGVEAAGVNVLGGDTPIGSGSTIYDDGGARFSGVVTATSFVGNGANLTGIDATAIQTGNTKVQTSATLISNQISGSGIATVQAGGLDVTGIVTATGFVGDGSGLVGVASTDFIITGTAATFTNKVDITNGTLELPVGNSLARNNFANVGDFRYNTTTGKLELYNGSAWENVGNSQPLVNNISPTSFSGAAGTSITIVGQNFVNGANVHFVSSINGSSTAAGSVAFVNSGILTATTPQLTVAGEPYGVKVTNPDGGQTLLEAALDAGSSPTFTTAAGSIGSGIQKSTTLSGIAVTATDPDGQAVTYSEVTSVLTSNANTPAATMNLTLNSSTGAITGTAPNVSSDTTYNFTIRASDGVNTTDRNFSLGIQAASDPVYFFRGSAHGGTGGSDTSVVTSWGTTGNNSNSSGSGNANNDRLYVYKNGSSRTSVGIHQYLYSTNAVTIPADHDKFKVVISSYSNNTHGNSYGWSGNTPSGTSNHYVSGANWGYRGTGTFIDNIPASMQGNAYRFTIGVFCGQYCNSQHQATLAVTYNSANPP